MGTHRARWIFAGPYLALCAAIVAAYFIHAYVAGGEVIDLYGPLLSLFGLPWSAAVIAVDDRLGGGWEIILVLLAPLVNAALLYAVGVWRERRRGRALPT